MLRYEHNLSISVTAACETADRLRHQFLTPEHILLAITMLHGWQRCEPMIPDIKRRWFQQELHSYILNLEQTPEDLWEEIKDQQEQSIPVSDKTQELFNQIAQQCAMSEQEEARVEHFLHALFYLEDSFACYLLNNMITDRGGFIGAITHENRFDENATAESIATAMEAELNQHEEGDFRGFNPGYSDEDYDTRSWIDGGLDSQKDWREEVVCINDIVDRHNPLIGRELELERTIQVLCRKDKNNPLHIGEPGVGKTAIIYGLARMINEGRVPDRLKGAKIYRMEMGGLVAGTRYRGDFEEKLKKILDGVGKERNAILYIDEIHTMMGAGATSDSSLDASNILKRYLEESDVRFIGSTTFEDHKRSMGRNRAVSRRFQEIEICEPSIEETVKILNQLQEGYERFHGVTYAPGVMEFATRMSAQHIHGRFLPDKALDLIDEAGAWRELHPDNDGTRVVDEALVAEILSKIARVEALAMDEEKTENTKSLADRILANVYGQNAAVTDVVESILMARAGLTDENHPMGSFLFVGPTGVGKTELAKVLAKEMGIGLVRFDMSEYSEKHAVAKLIGSPAGYVGYDDGGLLTDAIIKRPNCVLLLDEIEKAHSDIYDILLQVMDNGKLTDNRGREADFSHVILIMTSNAGARYASRASVGFGSSVSAGQAMLIEVKKTFKPEFINRLTAIEVFNDMDSHMADMILDKALRGLKAKLEAKCVGLRLTDKARRKLLEEGMTREYGAREMQRVIERKLTKPLRREILFGVLSEGGLATVDIDEDGELKIAASRIPKMGRIEDYMPICTVFDMLDDYAAAYDIDDDPICSELWFPDPRYRASIFFEQPIDPPSGYERDESARRFELRKYADAVEESLNLPLCAGGDLNPLRLLLAYSFGIFPWYDIKSKWPWWWAPLSRFVLFPDEIHISHSMRTLLNKKRYRVTVNEAFPDVIEACRTVDGRNVNPEGSWLGEDIIKAYTELWKQGYVKSVEVWDNESGKLAGGLYGVWVNRCFMGESMFSFVPSGSKIALLGLCEWMRANGGKVIDLQIKTDHLASMGGRYISYMEYLQLLNPKAAESAIDKLLDISYRNGNAIP